MYIIRKATISDVAIIIALAEKTWWPSYSPILAAEQISFMLSEIYSTEKITTQIKDNVQTYLILEEGIALLPSRLMPPGMRTPKFTSCINFTACPKHRERATARCL